MSVSLLEQDPVATFLMGTTTVTITLGIMNLILTVIVERAAEARSRDVDEVARQKLQSKAEAWKELLRHCEKMDKDGNGKLSLTELMTAYECSTDFRNMMTAMDLSSTELETIFDMADSKGTGQIEYTTFCDELFHLKTRDHHSQLAMMRLTVHDSHQILKQISPGIDILAEQSAMLLAQVAVLDQKVEQLMIPATASPIAPTCCVERRPSPEDMFSQESREVPAVMHPTGNATPVHVTPLCSDEGLEPSEARHYAGAQTADLNISELQTWGKNQQKLQRELQILMDVNSFLVNEATSQVDMSLSNVTNSFHILSSTQGDKNIQDIKTMEVWISDIKYRHCQSTLGVLSCMDNSQPMDQHQEEWQNVPKKSGRVPDMVHMRKQLLDQLKNLLLHLLQLDAGALPRDLALPEHYTKSRLTSSQWIETF